MANRSSAFTRGDLAEPPALMTLLPTVSCEMSSPSHHTDPAVADDWGVSSPYKSTPTFPNVTLGPNTKDQ